MKLRKYPGNYGKAKCRALHWGLFATVWGLLFLGFFTPQKAQARAGAFGNQPQIVWMLRNS